MEYKKVFKVSEITDIKPGPNSHKEIMEMVSQRRPYCLNDFKKQYFIPDSRHQRKLRHVRQYSKKSLATILLFIVILLG